MKITYTGGTRMGGVLLDECPNPQGHYTLRERKNRRFFREAQQVTKGRAQTAFFLECISNEFARNLTLEWNPSAVFQARALKFQLNNEKLLGYNRSEADFWFSIFIFYANRKRRGG